MDIREVVSANLSEQRELLKQGALSSAELVAATLEGIEQTGELRAFTHVMHEEALAEAVERDRERAAGKVGPLQGIPVAVKDEDHVAGVVTSFGTRANSTPARVDSEVVRRLRAAGAVIVGKTAMSEFGQWPFTESSTYGITRNPWDPTRTPGGSSGGSAAAVAAGLVPAATAGDGGGSIRVPAACCGLFGLKPQRGRVSAAPAHDLWLGIGVIGALARGVLDTAIVYDVIRGNTAVDRFTAPDPVISFEQAARRAPGRLRIGYSAIPQGDWRELDPAHARALTETAALLADLGHEVFELAPDYPDTRSTFMPQYFAAVREEVAALDHPEQVERFTRRNLANGAGVRAEDAEQAMRAAEVLAHKADRIFTGCDLLLTPTLACRPQPIGRLDQDRIEDLIADASSMLTYNALWNVTGHPAASVPVGIAEDGLPLAVQLVAPFNGETTILSVAAQLELVQPHPRPNRRADIGPVMG